MCLKDKNNHPVTNRSCKKMVNLQRMKSTEDASAYLHKFSGPLIVLIKSPYFYWLLLKARSVSRMFWERKIVFCIPLSYVPLHSYGFCLCLGVTMLHVAARYVCLFWERLIVCPICLQLLLIFYLLWEKTVLSCQRNVPQCERFKSQKNPRNVSYGVLKKRQEKTFIILRYFFVG